MENFAVSLVCIALLIIGALSVSMSALNSINSVSDALRTEEVLANDIRDTSISCKTATSIGSGTSVIIDIDNTGKTDLLKYDGWDVIVRYQDGGTQRIPYRVATPGWTTSGFFFPGHSGDLRA
jgi:hypothetical protein